LSDLERSFQLSDTFKSRANISIYRLQKLQRSPELFHLPRMKRSTFKGHLWSCKLLMYKKVMVIYRKRYNIETLQRKTKTFASSIRTGPRRFDLKSMASHLGNTSSP